MSKKFEFDKTIKSESSEKLSDQFKSLAINTQKDSAHKNLKRRTNPISYEETPVKFSRSTSTGRSNSQQSPKSNEKELKSILSKNDRIEILPAPPKCGKLGKPVNLYVNCFRVHCKTERISHYTVRFEPEIPQDAITNKLGLIWKHYMELKLKYDIFFYDDCRLWSLNKIEEKVVIPDEHNSIEISYVKSVDMKNAHYDQFNQIIHVILQRALTFANLVKLGRSFYDKNSLFDKKLQLDKDQILLFRGFSMGIEQTFNGLQLTADVNHRVISMSNIALIIDTYDKYLPSEKTIKRPQTDYSSPEPLLTFSVTPGFDNRKRENNEELKKRAEEEIVGRYVVTSYRMRIWRVDAIDWTINIDSKFKLKKDDDGNEVYISYRDYYTKHYRLKLTNERYGMLVNIPKVKRKKGPDRFVLPPEACHLTGISPKMKADNRLMKRIRDISSLTPPQRLESICKVINWIGEALESEENSDNQFNDSSEERKEKQLQLHIETRPLQIRGRILNPVFVQIKRDGSPFKTKATELMRHWSRAQHVNTNAHTVGRWIVFHERNYNKQANMLVGELMKTAGRYRMLKTPLDLIQIDVEPGSRNVFNRWKDKIEDIIERVPGLHLIVALIPNHFRSDEVYSAVKSATLMNNKKLIPSQCIKASRFDFRGKNALRSVISSTLKQVLTKRGNIPWIVNFEVKGSFDPFNGKTMLCGIDVNHDVKRNRSTAGFCVSGDSRYCRYDTFVSIGPVGRENIEGAEKCMVKSLINFHTDNGHLPDHVVVYRDGVSNSQLTKIYETEVKSFLKSFKHREVLKRVKGTYWPKLTFLVVQKRVSLRIFNERKMSADPGTVIDTGIVSSRFWDFYMLTTSPPRGKTSRPTRYIVVYDDFGVENDSLQAFTNQLCHTYYNFPGPIRVPAPCQIAHQVAYLYGSIIAEAEQTMLFKKIFLYKF